MIEKCSFGRMVISGITYSIDLKIITGKVVPDWWRESGHVVLVEDVEDILRAKPQYIIIGTGIGGGMKVNKDLRQEFNHLGIELIVESTPIAMKIFNRMFDEGKNIAAGFHLTC